MFDDDDFAEKYGDDYDKNDENDCGRCLRLPRRRLMMTTLQTLLVNKKFISSDKKRS